MTVRTRLAATTVLVVVVVAVAVGAITVTATRNALQTALVDRVVADTRLAVTTVAPAAGLGAGATADQVATSSVLDRVTARGVDGAWVEFAEAEPVYSHLSMAGGPSIVSDVLRSRVTDGQLAWELAELDDQAVVIAGGRLGPDGPWLYVVESAETIREVTSRQVRSAVAVAAGVAAVAAVVAGLLARGVLRPVARAGAAARRIADGSFDVRLSEGSDELGRLGASFNTMAASLEATITSLEAARARERRFVADVTHELRTPVTSLVTAARMVHDRLQGRADAVAHDTGSDASGPDAGGSDDTVELAQILTAEADRLATLVQDLLEVSRLAASDTSAAASDVDVAELVATVVDHHLPSASVRVDVPATVRVAKVPLERILTNLVDNARRHAEGAQVEVTAAVDHDHLVVRVADRGPGVPDEHLEAVFERFATADESRASGTGLGLAIAREHARLLGGSLDGANRPDGGFVATLRVPVAQLLPGGDDAAMPAPDSGGSHDEQGLP